MTEKQKKQLMWGGLFMVAVALLWVLLHKKGITVQTASGDVILPPGSTVPPGDRGYTAYNMPGYSPPTIEGNKNSIWFPPPGDDKDGCCSSSCCGDDNPLQPGVPYWAALVYGG